MGKFYEPEMGGHVLLYKKWGFEWGGNGALYGKKMGGNMSLIGNGGIPCTGN